MAITVELAFGQIITVDRDTATIGSAPGSDILIFDSPKIQSIHAKIIKVANKWMIESAGDWLLQVADGVPGRKLWLNPGDVVHLAESGPYIVFAPKPITPKSAVRSTEPDKTIFSSTIPQDNPSTAKKKDSPAPIEKAKKPETIPMQVDEDDEVWQEVYGYWMEDRNKKKFTPNIRPPDHPSTPPPK
jgi:hypothetical protein